MSRLAIVLCLAGLAACAADTQDESEMATDSAMLAPAPPAGISLADVQGSWNVRVMPLDRDTVVTTYVLSANDTTWTLTFPGREPIPMHIVAVDGDSIVTHVGPFQSAVRSGNVTTEANSVVRLQNGMLVGTVVAHYKVTTPDSVATFRTEGTRAQ